jgi:hypothetical protein
MRVAGRRVHNKESAQTGAAVRSVCAVGRRTHTTRWGERVHSKEAHTHTHTRAGRRRERAPSEAIAHTCAATKLALAALRCVHVAETYAFTRKARNAEMHAQQGKACGWAAWKRTHSEEGARPAGWRAHAAWSGLPAARKRAEARACAQHGGARARNSREVACTSLRQGGTLPGGQPPTHTQHTLVRRCELSKEHT